MFKKHADHLKNNPEQYWFRRNILGWVWVPTAWQGWFVTLLYVVSILLLVCTREEVIPGNPDSGSNFLVFGLPIILLTTLFVFIVYKKGEKLK